MAIIHFPHPIKSYKKVHRLVILPDYQGIGLGTLFLNWTQQNANIVKPINKTSSGQQKYQKI